MLNYQLEIVGEEFVTSIGPSDEFYVNLHFDRSIYRPMCTHMDITYSSSHCILFQEKIKLKKIKIFSSIKYIGLPWPPSYLTTTIEGYYFEKLF